MNENSAIEISILMFKIGKYTLGSTHIVGISINLDTLAGPSTGKGQMTSCIHLGSILKFKLHIKSVNLFFEKTTNNPKHLH